jgi:ketosteroid isomerase-like protein
MDTLHDIAERIRAAFAAGPDASWQTMKGLYADEFEVIHHPPVPGDGLVKRDEQLPKMEAQSAGMASLQVGHKDVSTEVVDDTVVLRWTTTAVVDGEHLEGPERTVLTFVDGKICRSEQGGVGDQSWQAPLRAAAAKAMGPPSG